MKERRRRAFTHTWKEGTEAERRMRRRNAEPEASIDLDMTNERRLILRRCHPRRHPHGKGLQLPTFKSPLKDISYSSERVQLTAHLIKSLNMLKG